MSEREPEVILATDCGSTTTKAILILKEDGEWQLKVRGEAPTTVESPFDDVTIGVLNATREVEELSGLSLIKDDHILCPRDEKGNGCDLYVSTSSAGGGLQMMVAGVVRTMTAESAERAALGAGAIVMDVVAVDDGREDYQRIERIRNLRPDMILLSGGTEGGTITHVVEMAELLVAADPRPRLGIGFKIPVIFAGNREARPEVTKLLEGRVALQMADNLRPTLEREALGDARGKVHDLFLEHVMQQAPGYGKLMSWTSADIMPTPQAVGSLVEAMAKERRINVLAVDIGGATTDIFSVFGGTFTRTVSANLGLSYSVCNVLAEAGTENVMRWVSAEVTPQEVRNRLRNKMIRPTTIPQTIEDLLIEQAVAREALRLALDHHRQLAVTLKGVQASRTIADALDQTGAGETIVEMLTLDMIIGSGGVLSHAPERAQAALMMIDGFQPEGVTTLAVDSIFMMPQLGVLATKVPDAATAVFERDCLIFLGPCVVPVGNYRQGQECMRVSVPSCGIDRRFKWGDLEAIPLGEQGLVEIEVDPGRGVDVGAGRGNTVRRTVQAGVVGLMVDCRGRPLPHISDPAQRAAVLKERYRKFGTKV